MAQLVAEDNFPAAALQASAGKAAMYLSREPVSFSLSSSLEKRKNQILKRTADILLSSILIVSILSWLIPLFGILIKLDSRGPVFFRQKRNREQGKLFDCLKFRTMIVNDHADMLAARINDERVTRFGKFLRDHYLDELPQLLNVLLGHMSMVGPRPHMISDNLRYEKLVKNYAYRHHIKPGMTGLAQVRGYAGHIGDLNKIKARVTMDLFYVQHWSASLDLMILYRTVLKSLGK